MNLIYAIFFGAIQGITEFLPVSSSGHLVIAQALVPSIDNPGVLFDVILHAGTLLAVIIFFRKKILSLQRNEIILLGIGTIPAVLVGVLFGSALEAMFSNVKAVGVEIIISGILCFAIDRAMEKQNTVSKKQSLFIGIAQAIAIIPGISRSGSTIFAGTAMGIKKAKVAEFSFLLSIPAIAGAIVYEVAKYGGGVSGDYFYYIVGFASSFIFGIFSIKILLSLLKTKRFFYFGIYCLIVGSIVFLGF
jgi:undecaprenyl-diphosphatase